MARRTALYTTFYPGVEKFLGAWARSVEQQTDGDFDLWISLDNVPPEQAQTWIGPRVRANWITHNDASPASIRDHAFRILASNYKTIVLVDADDILGGTRLEAANRALERSDVDGCALWLIDDAGRDLRRIFKPTAVDPERLLPRHNVFGLSNTAYRSSVLERCLPIPPNCALIDWLLATRAWCFGARMSFDATPHMHYRQHGANTAGVLGPFSTAQVLTATRLVLGHYDCLLNSGWPLPAACGEQLDAARHRAEEFYGVMSSAPERLDEYVTALNQLEPEYVWWWSVAHHGLEELWRS